MLYNCSMSKNRIGIILLLLLLTVGFATVTANLIINNNANISANTGDFDVIFYSASTDEESSAIISNDKKTITYNTKELVKVGDKTELTYEIKNNSSQYDADINMVVTLDNNYNDYFRITYEGIDVDNTVNILAKEIKEGKITIELIKPFIDNTQISITVTFYGNAVERESIAYDTYTVRFNPNGGTGEMDEQTIYYDESTSLAHNEFVKDGYQLLGWSINPDSSTLDYVDGEEVLKLTSSHTTKDLYAVWMKSEYPYTASVQTFTVPLDGRYKVELWGAQGGAYGSYLSAGAYTSGDIELTKDENLYVYVGRHGMDSSRYVFNYGYQNYGNTGGGSTDIRVTGGNWDNTTSLNSRIMVAAGGGGAGGLNSYDSGTPYGGAAGGLSGYRGGPCISNKTTTHNGATGATQTSGHGFGYIANTNTTTNGMYNTTGGNGYYAGNYYNWTGVGGHSAVAGAGGGSSFISGHAGCVAITSASSRVAKSGCSQGTTNIACSKHYSGKYFINTVMIDGLGHRWTNTVESGYTQMPNPEGGYYSLQYGNVGNGYARITYLG